MSRAKESRKKARVKYQAYIKRKNSGSLPTVRTDTQRLICTGDTCSMPDSVSTPHQSSSLLKASDSLSKDQLYSQMAEISRNEVDLVDKQFGYSRMELKQTDRTSENSDLVNRRHFSTHLKQRHRKARFHDSFIQMLKNDINSSFHIKDLHDISSNSDEENRLVGELAKSEPQKVKKRTSLTSPTNKRS